FYILLLASSYTYTLSLHDALPISAQSGWRCGCPPACRATAVPGRQWCRTASRPAAPASPGAQCSLRNSDSCPLQQGKKQAPTLLDRKSTRLNSSHVKISYAVFCFK